MNHPTYDFGGHARVLNILPAKLTCALPRFADRYATLEPVNCFLDYGIPILDQKQTSACGGYSSTSAVMTSHAIRSGGQVLHLAPTYPYSKANHGRDQGVILSELLEALKEFGVSPLTLFPESALFIGQGAMGADEAAQRFRVEEALVLRTAAELVSAILMGQPCVMGILVYQGIENVDAEGVIPDPQGQPRGGHALKVDEVYLSKRRGLCVGGPNSWGPSFGRQGRYRCPVASYLQGPIDAFALESLVPDPLVDSPSTRAA